MAEIILNIQVKQAGDITAVFRNDINAMLKDINEKTKKALDFVGVEMMEALKRHIDNDVYAAEAYTPTTYIRRKDHPEFGTPLNNVAANSIVSNKGTGLSFIYAPNGSNRATTADLPVQNKYYDPDNPKPIKPEGKAVHGDDLIRRIETGEGYDWKPKSGSYPKRPFWQNFVNEMVDMGEMERFFVAAMRLQDPEIEIEETGTEREAQDGDY